ncbi:MAG: flagellar protein FlgN [Geopsychrobacter sp.]|nr:flagellar protein FlgN [Geopsychrobacter sp.]
MVNSEPKASFEKLHQLLLEERQAAISLDMERLQRTTQAKQALLEVLGALPPETSGFEGLLKQIDDENRRNAYLILTSLSWVRETMCFFGQSTTAQAYGGVGQSVKSRQEGHLLTGKV